MTTASTWPVRRPFEDGIGALEGDRVEALLLDVLLPRGLCLRAELPALGLEVGQRGDAGALASQDRLGGIEVRVREVDVLPTLPGDGDTRGGDVALAGVEEGAGLEVLSPRAPLPRGR
jgi:hypothetical protein